jgi:hypothetical protein
MTIDVPQATALAVKRDVELVQAGQWDLSTGRVTFTTGDLASAVAALDCPAVRNPVLKLGHIDPRFDGEPAVGWVDNIALADSGNTIVGDYVGMPAWLGDVIASAYPDRSVEGCFDFRCQLGHTHPFVLTAVALLGVMAPGVGTLESLQDVAALYGVVNAAGRLAGHRVAVTVHATREEPAMPNPRPVQVAAGVSSEDVRRAYYESAPYSVWVCEMQLDPLQLITVNDEDGQYARVPVNLDGDKVTFGAPVPVVIEYVDKPQDQQTAASALVFASRAESREPVTVNRRGAAESVQDAIKRIAAASGLEPADEADTQTPPAEPDGETQEEGETMALPDGLRERLGLAEDADDEAILAAVDKLRQPEPKPDPDEEQGDGEETEDTPASSPPPAQPAGTVTIDEATWAQLREQAAEGVAARAQQRTEARDRAIGDAIMAGKIPPARREHWEQAWKVDAEGARQALASLAPGLVPVEDKGAPGGEATTESLDAEFDRMFPPHTIAKG